MTEVVDGRLRDNDGHLWPVTGYWCRSCLMPLIPVAGSTTHPNCEEKK